MAKTGGNTRFIATPDEPARVWKVRRKTDGRYKQVYSVTESSTDEDRWGHAYDRIWVEKVAAEQQAAKEKFPCEAVAFRLIEDTN